MNSAAPTNQFHSFRKYYKPFEPILQKPKNRVYTTTVLSFLTVSLFIWYAIRPTLQTILSLRREIKDSTAVNEQMETKIAALVEAQASYQEITPKLHFLQEAVPQTPNMVNFMIQLRDLAKSVDATVSGISMGSVPLTGEKTKSVAIQPTPTENEKQPDPSTQGTIQQNQNQFATPLVVNVEGTYESIRQFLLGIYSLRRVATIIDLSLLPRVNEAGIQQLIMTIKINTYSMDE